MIGVVTYESGQIKHKKKIPKNRRQKSPNPKQKFFQPTMHLLLASLAAAELAEAVVKGGGVGDSPDEASLVVGDEILMRFWGSKLGCGGAGNGG